MCAYVYIYKHIYIYIYISTAHCCSVFICTALYCIADCILQCVLYCVPFIVHPTINTILHVSAGI